MERPSFRAIYFLNIPFAKNTQGRMQKWNVIFKKILIFGTSSIYIRYLPPKKTYWGISLDKISRLR